MILLKKSLVFLPESTLVPLRSVLFLITLSLIHPFIFMDTGYVVIIYCSRRPQIFYYLNFVFYCYCVFPVYFPFQEFGIMHHFTVPVVQSPLLFEPLNIHWWIISPFPFNYSSTKCVNFFSFSLSLYVYPVCLFYFSFYYGYLGLYSR